MKNLKNSFKISFTGDILCDYPELKYSQKNNYNFNSIFNNLKIKEDCDFLVGNLETPICSFLPYTFEPYSFNSPKNFVYELKKIGFDLLSIANNHCLDRGIIGAKSTINVLKKIDIIPSGIYTNFDKNYNVCKIKNKKIAFISYTYGTNYTHNHFFLKEDSSIHVNLLKRQSNDIFYSKFNYLFNFIKNYLKSSFLWTLAVIVKNKILKNRNIGKKAYIKDDIDSSDWIIDHEYLNNMITTIKNAKNESDFVIFLLHSGGQFNSEVGTYTRKIVDIITKQDVDLVIGNHPHIVQCFEIVNKKPVFYSLGNFTFSPMSKYVNFEYKPDYSIKVNCYVKDNILKFSFEILKVTSNKENNHSSVVNTYELKSSLSKKELFKLIDDCNFIINRVKNTKDIKYIDSLAKEYFINEEEYKNV